ncbi:MAG TPA: NUDIX domain-containing protein [Gammaproteobacteria bacterium]|jgi:bis(5'-nucleosidyl)-tetraphosphatase|nr:NUDIX domain-containing protein [Gammaproteobacteria bacterium]
MDAKRRLSAGVVVVRDTAEGPLYLLLRAYKHWDFPKGMVEADETPLEAARREVAEETGIASLDFAWGEVYRETAPYARGKVARYYLARTGQSEVALTPNPQTGIHEHMEYRWVDLDEALSLVTPRVKHIIDWAKGCMAPGSRP